MPAGGGPLKKVLWAGVVPCKIFASQQASICSASETDAKIVIKSIPQEASGHPKLSQSRSRDSLRTPGSTKSILGATRERLGSVSGRPRRGPEALGGPPGAPWDSKIIVRECLGASQGVQNRRQVASGSEKKSFRSCNLLAESFRSSFSRILGRFSP